MMGGLAKTACTRHGGVRKLVSPILT
ncbi:hypothetical protein XHV734_2783 [Xanthomonas hortorum pv. vitians]|nr:hypothetical protein XHV734_2783 [Xanthomonas hortorum pv. vitians]